MGERSISMHSRESACGSKELEPLSRFPLRGQAGAGGFPPRRPARCAASKKRWHASCAGSPHKRAAAPLCIPCERCSAGFENLKNNRGFQTTENRLHKKLDTTDESDEQVHRDLEKLGKLLGMHF